MFSASTPNINLNSSGNKTNELFNKPLSTSNLKNPFALSNPNHPTNDQVVHPNNPIHTNNNMNYNTMNKVTSNMNNSTPSFLNKSNNSLQLYPKYNNNTNTNNSNNINWNRKPYTPNQIDYTNTSKSNYNHQPTDDMLTTTTNTPSPFAYNNNSINNSSSNNNTDTWRNNPYNKFNQKLQNTETSKFSCRICQMVINKRIQMPSCVINKMN